MDGLNPWRPAALPRLGERFNLRRGAPTRPHSIKSRWRASSDHVGRATPEVLADIDRLRDDEAVRGHEKRRRLLEYVRRHPEELRSAPTRQMP